MKPFNLEAAKAGEPLVTRDGRAAVCVGHGPRNLRYPVVAHIQGNENLSTHGEDGSLYSTSETPDDLFMAPKTRTAYVNIYDSRLQSGKGSTAAAFDTAEAAANNATNNGVRLLAVAVPVTIEA